MELIILQDLEDLVQVGSLLLGKHKNIKMSSRHVFATNIFEHPVRDGFKMESKGVTGQAKAQHPPVEC